MQAMEVKCIKCESTDIVAYVTEKSVPLCVECFKKFMAGDTNLDA